MKLTDKQKWDFLRTSLNEMNTDLAKKYLGEGSTGTKAIGARAVISNRKSVLNMMDDIDNMEIDEGEGNG